MILYDTIRYCTITTLRRAAQSLEALPGVVFAASWQPHGQSTMRTARSCNDTCSSICYVFNTSYITLALCIFIYVCIHIRINNNNDDINSHVMNMIESCSRECCDEQCNSCNIKLLLL